MGGYDWSVIEADLASVSTLVSDKLALLKHCREGMEQVTNERLEAERNEKLYAEATQFLRDLYEQAQERYHGQITQIVSYCLREVFGDDAYSFKIIFEQKRNQVEASLVFERDGELFDPIRAAGGGVLSVACFALRLAVLYLSRRAVRPLVVLDEPFGQLSVEYRDRMAVLLRELSKQFGFQFIVVTHANEFELGRIYHIDGVHKITMEDRDE